MEYNSFYGGRQGASFVIVKRYDNIQQMTEDFAKGPEFTEVNFDEYVIIDNKNRNDPDNGKLFRRGYDFDSDRTIVYKKAGNDFNNIPEGQESEFLITANGAEYVGTITGASGKFPYLRMTDIGSVLEHRYENNPTLKFIQNLDLQLKQYYSEYYNIRSEIIIGKYRDQINHLRNEQTHIDEIEGISQDNKEKIREQLEQTINNYQSLIDQSEEHVPDLEEKINILLKEKIEPYVQIEEDRDPNFLNNQGTDWRWNRTIGDTDLKFIKYKIKKVKPSPDEPERYAIIDESLIEIGDSDIAYSFGSYDTNSFIDIVPGKYIDNNETKFNDVIEYACVTVPDDNDNSRATAWFGFKFPYLVNEFETQDTDQYDQTGSYSSTKSSIKQIKPYDHPFYEKWKIAIPVGKHGTDIISLSVEHDDLQDDSSPLGLYYKLKNYDNLRQGEQSNRIKVASYDIIDNINISSNGLITINYSGTKSSDTFHLDLIDSIRIDHDEGKIYYHHTWHIDENSGEWVDNYEQEEEFDYVKGVIIDEDKDGNSEAGTIIFKHTNSENDQVYSKYLKVIDNINKVQSWKYDVLYNTTDDQGQQEKDTFIFEYVDKFRINAPEQEGEQGTVDYHIVGENGGSWIQIGNINIDKIDRFERFEFDPLTGELYTVWKDNNDEETQELQGQIIIPIKINQDESSGEINVVYTNNNVENIGKLNFIKEIRYDKTEGKFYSKTNGSNEENPISGEPIEYANRFRYVDSTGRIQYLFNTDASSSTNWKNVGNNIIKYPQNLKLQNGTFSSSTNVDPNTWKPIGTIEYINQLKKIRMSGENNFKFGIYDFTNLNPYEEEIPEKDPIYILEKTANEIRLTSDFYIIARYNDFDSFTDNDYETIFGQNWRYAGADSQYTEFETDVKWVNLGCPGKRVSQYDVSVITRNDFDLGGRGVPKPLKEGGILFIVDGRNGQNPGNIPIDYYKQTQENHVDEETPETIALDRYDYEDGSLIPNNFNGIIFIVDHEQEPPEDEPINDNNNQNSEGNNNQGSENNNDDNDDNDDTESAIDIIDPNEEPPISEVTP